MADITTINKNEPLRISENKLRFNILTGIPAVKQSILTRVQTFKTEFFLNRDYGVDWYGIVLAQGVQNVEKDAEITDVVRGTNGVTSLVASEILRDSRGRKTYYFCQVISDGQIVVENVPFDFVEREL